MEGERLGGGGGGGRQADTKHTVPGRDKNTEREREREWESITPSQYSGCIEERQQKHFIDLSINLFYTLQKESKKQGRN